MLLLVAPVIGVLDLKSDVILSNLVHVVVVNRWTAHIIV